MPLSGSVPPERPPARVWNAIDERTGGGERRSSTRRWSWLRPVCGIAFGILATLGVVRLFPDAMPIEAIVQERGTLPQSYVGLLTDAQNNAVLLASSTRYGHILSPRSAARNVLVSVLESALESVGSVGLLHGRQLVWAVSYYVLFVMELPTRRVCIAGITTHPDMQWMLQMARQLTDGIDGILVDKRYIILDRDTKYCQAFRDFLKRERIAVIRLPPRSPNLNAHAERRVRGVRDECLSRLIPIGQGIRRRALRESGAHFHQERNHQGLGNVLIMPAASSKHRAGPVIRRARLEECSTTMSERLHNGLTVERSAEFWNITG